MVQLFLNAISQVLVIGLLIGAGLPAIFALGIRAMAYGVGGTAEVDQAPPHLIGKVLAALCFTLVVLVIALGISIIVSSGFGYSVSFEHIFPTFTKKR